MTPYEAYDKARKLGKRIPELEPFISKDALYSFCYARDVIKVRWEIAEPIISKDAHLSYLYAKNVIKGRWEQGELVIGKDAYWSYRYARYVIKGRLPDFMHNAVLLSNDEFAKYYIEYIK